MQPLLILESHAETYVMSPIRRKMARLNGLKIIQPIDFAIWTLVMLFFGVSALVSGGDLKLSLFGAAGIVMVMFVVGASIEVLLDSISDIRGLGTVVGFITNGPEALCLLVGLLSGNILYAASTPLGSNVINPLMLIVSAILTGQVILTSRTNPLFSVSTILITGALAVSFFFVPHHYHIIWVLSAVVLSAVLFVKRPEEKIEENTSAGVSRKWIIPAILILVVAGYYLDPVVSFAAEHSNAPKGRIGFFVLAALTSWPEFKSSLSLMNRGRSLAAVLNITVSNITNIWLAAIGVAVYLM